jgi:tRNA threonylcarbamoyladenosine biosynthesis protein TsaE
MHEVVTGAPEETEALAASLGRTAHAGALIGLIGDLGAGKTCFVRGLAGGLGADPDQVHSPSFTTATEYRGGRFVLHHVDVFRLEPSSADTLFLREVLYGEGVAAVEWFDRLLPAALDEVLLITLRVDGADRRTIRFEACGPRHTRWLDAALGT